MMRPTVGYDEYKGQLWKRGDKWVVECLNEDGVVTTYPVSSKYILIKESLYIANYGKVTFTLSSQYYAKLEQPICVTIKDGAEMMVQYSELSRLTEFYATKKTHQGLIFLNRWLKQILLELAEDKSIYPQLTEYRKGVVIYKTLERVKNNIPYSSTLGINSFIDNRMTDIVHDVFLNLDK
jgi:hypothetical protein